MANAKSYSNSDPAELAKALAAQTERGRKEVQEFWPRPGYYGHRKPALEEADRTPNWKKWWLIPSAEPWKCAALWSNINPDKVKLTQGAWPCFDESQDFKDRVELVEAHLYGALKSQGWGVDLRVFAAWAREMQKFGWDAPPELLAMAADEQAAINTHSEKRTGAATATRGARKTSRHDDEKKFIDDLYEAVNRDVFNLGTGNDRKPLPFSMDELHTLFCALYPEHRVARSTFEDDLAGIATVKPGRKCCEIKGVAEMLAKKKQSGVGRPRNTPEFMP